MPALASARMGHFVSKSREVIQDATDPHNRIVGFGDRHAFDAGLRGKTNLDPSPRRFLCYDARFVIITKRAP
jgi:hypothetical protein